MSNLEFDQQLIQTQNRAQIYLNQINDLKFQSELYEQNTFKIIVRKIKEVRDLQYQLEFKTYALCQVYNKLKRNQLLTKQLRFENFELRQQMNIYQERAQKLEDQLLKLKGQQTLIEDNKVRRKDIT